MNSEPETEHWRIVLLFVFLAAIAVVSVSFVEVSPTRYRLPRPQPRLISSVTTPV